MRYELLGPLRVSDGRESRFLSAPKMETTLAILLVRAEWVTTKEQLITELWGESPPQRASAALHVYISQLRKFLASAGHGEGDAIVTRASGYVLRLRDAEYDVADFQRAVGHGRMCLQAGRYEEALAQFEEALRLVRGPVLDQLPEGPVLAAFAAWAEEERLDCLELSIEARTALGRHREVIGPLNGLITQHPLRESFYRQLMLALYRSERQADALQVYRTAQRVLQAELGVQPCPALRRLHHAILTSDALLDLRAAS
ncbi:AfsR/SARP family transcriptional regulator [Herbidospora daliensis]|uniref:AfsR/SARP family transcriptional regulator n=1 Tax=Herbidospora daliensis TaxID=295585 RepID=UPI0007845C1D|nr:AfsR/SARP family transcriptional regulator [Herbidospora daliensis]